MPSRSRSRSGSRSASPPKKKKDRSRNVSPKKKKSRSRSPKKEKKQEESRSRSASKEKEKKKKKKKDKKKDKSRSRSSSRSSKRKKKDRHRSRSRSRGRRRSRSRSRDRRRRSLSRGRRRRRSRSRSRRPKREAKFDIKLLQSTLKAVSDMTSAQQQQLAGGGSAANPQLTRQARRLYIGNLPVGMGLTEKMLTEFFAVAVNSFGLSTPGPVLSTWLSSEGTFCFVEFRAVQDCTTCCTLLQGIQLGGRQLRVGRPADYKAPPAHLANFVVSLPPGAIAAAVQPGGSAAPTLSVDNPLAASLAGLTTQNAINLQMMQALQGGALGLGAANMAAAAAVAAAGSNNDSVGKAPTKVLLLQKMVSSKDLVDDEEFIDIVIDVREECAKYGKVIQVIIPRPLETPTPQNEPSPTAPPDQDDEKPYIGDGDVRSCDGESKVRGVGVGNIFVSFEDIEGCKGSLKALHGRKFNEQSVQATYYPDEKFKSKTYATS